MTTAVKSAMDMFKSAAKATPKSKDAKAILNNPELEPLIKGFLHHTSQAESHETMAKQAKEQLIPAAREFLFAESERTGKVLSSAVIQAGDLKATFSMKCQYSDVAVDDMPIIASVFGEETGKYFKEKLDIKIKEEAMTEELLGRLAELIGMENLEIKNTVKVTEAFHNTFVGSAAFREKCQGLMETGKVRPYSPTIKQ